MVVTVSDCICGSAVHTEPKEDPNAPESDARCESHTGEHRVTRNAVAPVNMLSKLVTLATFHVERSMLNAVAPSNILSMASTDPTFHHWIGWLNAVAPRNMEPISVTARTSHHPISWLKATRFSKSLLMSVMAETSHVPMAGEHTPIAEMSMQLAMAASRAALVV